MSASVVIADDHPLIRRGIETVLAAAPRISVLASVGDGEQLLSVLDELRPSVVLLDVSMPGPGLLSLLKIIGRRWPEIHVFVLSVHCEVEFAVRALRSGALGYASKDAEAHELVEGVLSVAGGKTFVCSVLRSQVLKSLLHAGNSAPHARLSNRELQVLRLGASGLRVKDIARRLHLSPKTISTYRTRILGKLGVASQAEAIRFALQHDLVD